MNIRESADCVTDGHKKPIPADLYEVAKAHMIKQYGSVGLHLGTATYVHTPNHWLVPVMGTSQEDQPLGQVGLVMVRENDGQCVVCGDWAPIEVQEAFQEALARLSVRGEMRELVEMAH